MNLAIHSLSLSSSVAIRGYYYLPCRVVEGLLQNNMCESFEHTSTSAVQMYQIVSDQKYQIVDCIFMSAYVHARNYANQHSTLGLKFVYNRRHINQH